jgi:hypothetical protein
MYGIPLLGIFNIFDFSHDRYSWSSPALSSTTFWNFPGISDLLFEVTKFQLHTNLCSESRTSFWGIRIILRKIWNYASSLRGLAEIISLEDMSKSKGKVHPCTGTEALTGRTAHRGSTGIALLFHDHGTRRRWGVSVTRRSLFTPGKDPVSIVQEAGWSSGSVWTSAENLAPTGIRSPDRPVYSQSL